MQSFAPPFALGLAIGVLVMAALYLVWAVGGDGDG